MSDDRPIKLFHAPPEEMSPGERTNLLELAMTLSRRYRGIAKVVMVKLPPKGDDE
jgi:hypothetical protein